MMATRDALGKFASTAWEAFTENEGMQWSAVSSSNVGAVGYNEATHVMGVTFNNGSTYYYFDVPESVFESLKTAGSVGGYLHAAVKGHYAYQRVG